MLLIEAYVATQTQNEGLDAIHDMIERFWSNAASMYQLPSETWRHLFTTALAEVAANGLRHAYPPDAIERPLWVRLRLFPDRVEALLIDWGAPYESSSSVPDAPEDDVDIATLPESGYGLFIARSALDSLRYRRTRSGYNCWKLVKKK
ncbi:MAG: ATP-binding protein [Roseiflexaceae bacterium]|nr:ATP-binding protein [Roseiflexaceae bacterium]